MQRTRAYETKRTRRRPKDIVRPADIPRWWQAALGDLPPEHRRTLVRHPATMQMCAFPMLSVKTAVTVENKLDAALERLQRQARGYSRIDGPVAPAAGPRRDLPASRSTWLGGDVRDVEEDQRHAEERRLARPDVNRPEPYL